MIHFVWAMDPSWRLLCKQEMAEKDMVTPHPALLTCPKCQDRILELWRQYVEPHQAEIKP